jgi:hypothetical protein
MCTLLWERLLHRLQTPLSAQCQSQEENTLNMVWSYLGHNTRDLCIVITLIDFRELNRNAKAKAVAQKEQKSSDVEGISCIVCGET